MIDLGAVQSRHNKAIEVGKKLNNNSLGRNDHVVLFASCSDVPELLEEIERLKMVLHTIEAPRSLLCDCDSYDTPPTNATTGAPIDHHCECSAVRAAAALFGKHRLTNHASQCVCADIYDD